MDPIVRNKRRNNNTYCVSAARALLAGPAGAVTKPAANVIDGVFLRRGGKCICTRLGAGRHL